MDIILHPKQHKEGSVYLKHKRCLQTFKSLVTALIFISSLFLHNNSYSQVSQTFTSSSSFIVPAGVNFLSVEAWGAGGRGGSLSNQGAGGGGGGGAYSLKTIAVIPGNSYTVHVGQGSNTSLPGGDSWFDNSSIILAKGGNSVTDNDLNGAIGGQSTSCIGDIVFNGGNGANGSYAVTQYGGGGGSSAGISQHGNNASGFPGAIAPSQGGNGGNGQPSTQGNGSAASAVGGGGGGALVTGAGSASGGSGADGKIVISWIPVYQAQFLSMNFGSTNWCAGETRTVTVTVKNTGQATWTDAAPDVNIGLKWNTNGSSWNDYYAVVDAGNLAPGGTATYSFTITASDFINGTGYTSPFAGGTTNQLSFDVIKASDCYFGNNTGSCGPGNAVFTSPVINIGAPPVVTQQTTTTPQYICMGNTASAISVVATGTGLTYQWFVNTVASNIGGTAVADQTSASFIPPTNVAGDFYYYCIISAACGQTVTSNPSGVVSVYATPVAGTISGNSAICTGTPVQLNANATGAGPLTYTWTSSNTAVATVSNTGLVTGLTSGTTQISYIVKNGNNCADTSAIFTIAVSQAVSITAQPATTQTTCATFPASFSVSAAGSGLNYQWFLGSTALTDDGNITGSQTANLSINSASLANAGDYHVVISGIAPCSPVTSNMAHLVVNKDIVITSQPVSVSQCAGTTASFTVAATGDGLNYQWRKGSAVLVDGGNISGTNTATLTISNISAANAAADYNVIVGGSGGICPHVISNNAALIVNPIPNASASPASQSICSGAAISTINLTGSVGGTTYNWTRDNNGNVSGIGASGSGNISGVLNNNTTTPQTVNFTITPTAAGCNGTVVNATVVVNPVVNVSSLPSTQTICSGASITNILNNSNIGSATINWTRDNTATVTGIPASGTGNISGTLSNNSFVPVTVTFSTTASAYGCNSNTVTSTVIVNPTAAASASPSTQQLCSGASITPIVITSTTPGAIFNWTRDNAGITGTIPTSGTGNISGTLVNSGTTPVTVTFTITPSLGTCNGTPVTATVVVNPVPSVSATPLTQSKCSGAAISSINITSNVTGAAYNWSRDNTATITGIAANGTGNISGTLSQTGNTAAATIFSITATANGCTSAPVQSTVIVNPTPAISATPATQATCNGAAIATISITNSNNVANTNYTWTRTNTGIITGMPASGSGNSITGSLTNTSVAYNFTVFSIIATESLNGCNSSATATDTVYAPLAAPIVYESQTVCVNNTPNLLIAAPASGGYGGFTYQWQSSLDGITWTNLSGSTGLTYQPPIVNNATPNTFYRLQAFSICGNVTSAPVYIEIVSGTGYTFTLNANVPSWTMCPGTTFSPTIESTHSATSYVRFTYNANASQISPASSPSVGTTGPIHDGFFRTTTATLGPLTTINNTNAPVEAYITITPSIYRYDNNQYLCTGAAQYIGIIINPTPTVNSISNQVLCKGNSTTAVNFTGFVPGTVYRWTNDNTSIGLAASGTGNIASFTTINNGTAPVVATITVTPEFTNAGKTCYGTSRTFTITVNPVAVANAVPNISVCHGAVVPVTTLSSNIASSVVYFWTNNTTSIGLGASGSGNLPSFTAVNNGSSPVTATITVTPIYVNGNSCFGTAKTFTITVNPLVQAGTISGPASLCVNATALFTTNGNAGGTWSSSNTSIATVDATGNVTALAPGTTNIIYTLNSGCGSPASSTKSFTVSANANAGTISGTSPACIGNTYTFSSNGNAGGTWSSDNTAVATVNSSTGLVTAVAAGSTVIRYAVGGCNPASSSMNITVNPSVNAGTVSGAAIVCIGASINLTSNGDAGGSWSSSNTSVATVNSSTGIVTGVGAGTAIITYSINSGCNSPASATKTITVPVNANAGTVSGPSPVCIGSVFLYLTTGDGGGTWSSSNTSVATINPTSGIINALATGTTTISYTVNSGCNSPITSSKILTVSNPAPAAPGSITGPASVCANTAGFIYSIAAVTNATTYTWTVPAGWNITAGQGTSSITVSSGASAGVIAVTAGNFCGNSSATSLNVGVTMNGTWTGLVSSDWNNAQNWCGGIPSASTNVIIPAGTPHNPVASATAFANNIAVDNGATLTVNNTTLQISGTISGNNNYIFTSGTLELTGTTAQVIPAGIFLQNELFQLLINNSSQVSLSGDLGITGSLTYGSNGTVFNSNDHLTLRSTAANTAWIGNMTGKTINGKVTVERYIPNHPKAWQHLAVPVTGNQTINQAWQDSASSPNQNRYPGYGTMLTGQQSNAIALGYDVYTPTGPSIKVFNSANGWYDNVPSTNSTLIQNNKGYMVLVRGDRSVIASNQAATATTLRTKGNLYTPANPPATITVGAGKFESIGNPYASAIDYSLVTKTGGVQTFVFYVWDPKLTQSGNSAYGLGGTQTFTWNGSSYDVTPGGGSYSGSNRYIESGQAFFVRAPLTAGTISFSENCKVSGSNLVTRPAGVNTDRISIRTNLRTSINGEDVLLDGNMVQLGNEYSCEVDNYDAEKLMNGGESLSITRDSINLSVESRKLTQLTDTIPLALSRVRVRNYSLEIIPSNITRNGLAMVLEDTYLGSRTVLNSADSNVYRFEISTDPLSYKTDRFRIILLRSNPTPVTFVSVQAKRTDNRNVNISWKVENEERIARYIVERSRDGIYFTGILTQSVSSGSGSFKTYMQVDADAFTGENYYRIRSVGTDGVYKFSNIVHVGNVQQAEELSVYPNPVTAKTIQLHSLLPETGNYVLRLINASGQLVEQRNIILDAGNAVRSIRLHESVPPGNYKIIITSARGTEFTQQVIIL